MDQSNIWKPRIYKHNTTDGIAAYLSGTPVTDIEKVGDAVKIEYENNDGTKKELVANLFIAVDGPSSIECSISQSVSDQLRIYLNWLTDVIVFGWLTELI